MITLNTACILQCMSNWLCWKSVWMKACLYRKAMRCMQGNRLSDRFIQRYKISFGTHQTELYQRYQNKYDRQ